jgi:aerobic carbon-monoxide dehydrogenase small subunit
MAEHLIKTSVNGKNVSFTVDSNERLIDMLRNRMNLTGTKEGCGKGDCGSCVVIVDGKTVNACLMLAPQAQGKKIVTIEGLGSPEKLHPIQESFVEKGAVQCGFCTPGMIITAKNFLDQNPNPTRQEIREAISGNLCRCTGYVKIVDAIQAAAEKMRR